MNRKISLPRFTLHLEALAIFVATLYLYHTSDASWGLFVLLFFIPDLSVLGYITRNKKIGAIVYDVIHNYVLALSLMAGGLFSDYTILYPLGIILAAHISFDRLIGFGLRYTDVFRVTHLQKL